MKNPLKVWLTLLSFLLFFSCLSKPVNQEQKEKANLYFNLGNAYSELERYEKAIEAYSAAYTIDSEFSAAGYNLARIYIHQKNYEQASLLISTLIEKEPRNTLLLETAGFLYHTKGELPKALSYYNRVLLADEVNSNALFNSYLIYKEQENFSLAMSMLQRYIEVNQSDTPSIKELASLYFSQDKKEEAINAYKLYLEKESSDKDNINLAKRELAKLYIDTKYYGDAKEILSSLTSENQSDADLLFDQAWVLLIGLEEYTDGMELLKKSIEAGFNDKERATKMASTADSLYHQEILSFMKEKKLYDPSLLK